jgi:putative spermidine/putrescine transport system ATP-binding protein
MQVELKEFHRRVGLTFIYVTHDQEEALSMSDRVAILNHGRLLQLGPPAELYERPATRFVAEFLGKSNFLRGTVEQSGPGGFTLRAGGALFRQSVAAAAPAVGAQRLLALRPERIVLVGDGPRPANVIDGTIASWSYLGTAFHLLVDTKDAGRVAVTVPTWRHGTPPAIGAAITLGWDPDASIQVEDDEGSTT